MNRISSIRRLRGCLAAATALLFLSTPPAAQAQVILNELLADNRSAVSHDGNHPDYIELHNPTDSLVDLSGWSLSDDPSLPKKFTFPVGSSVPAHGFLIVWSDDRFESPGLHTGFGLGANGDLLRLYHPNGVTIADEITFGLQIGDRSIGRIPDAVGSWTLNEPSPASQNTSTLLGAPNQLRINEWLARPAKGDDWLEVFNSDSAPVALGGLVITDHTGGSPGNRAIPPLSFIAERGFVQFFASDLDQPDADHLDFKLSGDGETLRIFAADRVMMLEQVVFGPQGDNVPQGRAPDGSDNIVSFSSATATPGASNFQQLTNVVVSEVLSHTDPPLEDAIELRNLTASPVDISHWWLSDSGSQPRKYRIPPGTTIASHGFAVFYHYQFGAGASGFALDAVEGDDVFLSEGDAAGNLTGAQSFVRFGASKNGIAFGRHETSNGADFVPLNSRTFGEDNPSSVIQFRQGTGLTNAAPRIGPIAINEIMFHPPGPDDEFIELHNPTAVAARLFDPLFPTNRWQIRNGITFDFPENLSIPAGEFLLVVGFNPDTNPTRLASFRSLFNVPTNVPIVGPYSGSLSDSGEALEMLEPDEPQGPLSPEPGFVPYMLAERIKYSIAAPWPATASGTGKSLQRRGPLDYGNEPLNWISAAPTAGRANILDSDNDGMPDDWELMHGLNPDSPSDATTDADGDRMANLHEFLAGTIPTNSASVLGFTGVTRDGDSFRFRFNAVQGRAYGLEAAGSHPDPIWQPVADTPPAASDGEVELSLPAYNETSRVFRLVTPPSQ